jgi:hypothetical protein
MSRERFSLCAPIDTVQKACSMKNTMMGTRHTPSQLQSGKTELRHGSKTGRRVRYIYEAGKPFATIKTTFSLLCGGAYVGQSSKLVRSSVFHQHSIKAPSDGELASPVRDRRVVRRRSGVPRRFHGLGRNAGRDAAIRADGPGRCRDRSPVGLPRRFRSPADDRQIRQTSIAH